MPVDHVWQELLSPTTLQHCIPGCESFTETTPHHFAATIKVGIGMIAVRFKAHIELTDMEAPNRCTLIFSGDAGALGSAKGIAHIELTASSETATTLHWRAKPELGGKIATLAGRMLQGLSQQLSGQFFKRFEQVITQPSTNETDPTLFTKIKNWLQQKFK
jgi:carbon monoxide dehydrogenase subunit G